MEQKNKGLIIALVISILLVVGLGGYFVYDKVLNISNNTNNKGNNDNLNNNNAGEINDETIIRVFAEKLDDIVGLSPKLLYNMKGGKPSDFTDFERAYISINSILGRCRVLYDCGQYDEEPSDARFDTWWVENNAKLLFGKDTKINHTNFAEFKNYPFSSSDNKGKYDASVKKYIIEGWFIGKGGYDADSYLKIPYKLVKDNDEYKLSYYLMYIDYGGTEPLCTRSIYTDETKKKLINEEKNLECNDSGITKGKTTSELMSIADKNKNELKSVTVSFTIDIKDENIDGNIRITDIAKNN